MIASRNLSRKLVRGAKTAAAAAAVGATGLASAAGADYSSLTGMADWSSAATGVVTIGVGLAAVAVAATGVRKLIAMFRG